MRLFTLQRNVDVSGISGTGVVAQCCEFSDGQCAISWQSMMPSICFRDSLEQVIGIHGHGGNTQVIFQYPLFGRQDYKPFWLGHTENRHGLSGVGLVAECCLFSNGWVVMHWLVPPYGVEVFSSFHHWERVHAILPHTYIKDIVEVDFDKGAFLDTFLADNRPYRRFTKGVWFYAKTPPMPDKRPVWVRSPYLYEDVMAVEVFI